MTASSSEALQRAHYLDALGLTLWVPRYRLPNARASEPCEWPQEAREEQPAGHAERLQKMLQEAEQVRPATPEKNAAHVTQEEPVAPSSEVRQLLGEPSAPRVSQQSASQPQTAEAAAQVDTPVKPPAPQLKQPDAHPQGHQPLRFAFDSMVLGNRWLLLAVGEYFDDTASQLADAILSAVGEEQRTTTLHVDFSWPIVEGFLADDPVAEASEGVRAFVEGRQFAGAELDRVLLFAGSEDDRSAPLLDVLRIRDGYSELLDLPLVVAPSLSTLYTSAQGKRELWQALKRVRRD